MLLHADSGKRLTSSNSNHEERAPAMTAKTEGVFWEHLMRIKGEQECLIKLANIKKVELEPRTSLHCLVYGFKLEAQ